ncbi:MAG: 2-nitropropane dioxygenase [Bacteroidetes bacterium GWA2_30_7]|nr:MAG: 2-nitropropane dioxygenase [Bacteroidetes bacterium GWA2_30_7]
MKSLVIGDIEVSIPIIQGGMGVGISLAGLASAVANMGAIGVVSSVGIGLVGNKPFKNYRETNINALQAELRKARSLTKGILGVNIMVAATNFADMVRVSIEEGMEIIFSGAGLPFDLPKYLDKNAKTKLVPIISSARAAKVLCEKWKNSYDYLPDAFVLEGPKAGGHLGFKANQIEDPDFQLEELLPQVVNAVKEFEIKYDKKIPVIAAGGIYTGEDILKFIKMGASGVQMGTRFVTTFECDASDEFKQLYINATEDDIRIIKSPVGMPGRSINNSFLEKVENHEKMPFNCAYHCIITCDYKTTDYCIAKALVNAQMGDMENGFAFAGKNASRVNKIISVRELIESLVEEYNQAEENDN